MRVPKAIFRYLSLKRDPLLLGSLSAVTAERKPGQMPETTSSPNGRGKCIYIQQACSKLVGHICPRNSFLSSKGEREEMGARIINKNKTDTPWNTRNS